MLFAPAVKRVLPVIAATSLLITLPGCASTFDIGGCTSANEIRKGECTPVDVDPNEHFDDGLSCMSIVSAPFWPGELAGTGHVDLAHVPDYDAEAAHQRWYCGSPEAT